MRDGVAAIWVMNAGAHSGPIPRSIEAGTVSLCPHLKSGQTIYAVGDDQHQYGARIPDTAASSRVREVVSVGGIILLSLDRRRGHGI